MRSFLPILTILAFLSLLVGVDAEQSSKDEKQQERLLISYREMEGRVVFYGQVVDQEGSPVVGAKVDVSVPTPSRIGSPMKERQKFLFTDEMGRFEVSGRTYSIPNLSGKYLYIRGIEKDGYDGLWNEWLKNDQTMFSFATSNKQRFVADKDSPVIYQMRKRNANTTFLVGEHKFKIRVLAADSGTAVGYDFIERDWLRSVARSQIGTTESKVDLLIQATFNKNDEKWTVILSSGNTNGGIIVSEQLLYEAPEKDYQPEYTFTPEERRPVKAKYVYLKSRDPAIYTRLEIQYINANKQFFRLIGKSVTNPYGDRNLEQATDLPYEVTKQLTDEAKISFRKDKRPTKPDLPKLIKQAKEKGKP